MSGVEIIEILTPGLAFTKILATVCLAGVLGYLVLLIICFCGHRSEITPTAIGLVICWVLFLFFGYTINNPVTEYKVTVDDSVTLNEFTEKYEMIEQEEDYYIVKEK